MKFALIGGIAALAAAVAAGAASPARVATVKVVHRDPGCHWYLKGGKSQVKVQGPVWFAKKSARVTTKLVFHGPVRVVNHDLGLQVIKGPAGTKRLGLGKSTLLTKRGHLPRVDVRPGEGRQSPEADHQVNGVRSRRREAARLLAFLLQQAVRERVPHQLGPGGQSKLLHDVRPMRLSRAD